MWFLMWILSFAMAVMLEALAEQIADALFTDDRGKKILRVVFDYHGNIDRPGREYDDYDVYKTILDCLRRAMLVNGRIG